MLANPKRHDQATNPMRLPGKTNAPICVDLVHMPTFIKAVGHPCSPPLPAPLSFALPSVQLLLSIICLPSSWTKQETICLIPQLKTGPSPAI